MSASVQFPSDADLSGNEKGSKAEREFIAREAKHMRLRVWPCAIVGVALMLFAQAMLAKWRWFHGADLNSLRLVTSYTAHGALGWFIQTHQIWSELCGSVCQAGIRVREEFAAGMFPVSEYVARLKEAENRARAERGSPALLTFFVYASLFGTLGFTMETIE